MCKILDIDAWAEGEVMIDRLIELIEPQKVDGKTSDGYHTFDELYDHRAKLFAVLVSVFKNLSWKILNHSDGSMYDGMFIVGIDTPEGPATYHYDLNYWNIFDCKEIKNAPEWDGHTSTDAINRILNMKNYILQASKCWYKDKNQYLRMNKDGSNVQKMVAEWLEENGYQGLYNYYRGCGCGLDHLMPGGLECIDQYNCVAAYEFRCCDCKNRKHCDYEFYDCVYSTDRDWCYDFESKVEE